MNIQLNCLVESGITKWYYLIRDILKIASFFYYNIDHLCREVSFHLVYSGSTLGGDMSKSVVTKCDINSITVSLKNTGKQPGELPAGETVGTVGIGTYS
jgi:hypothetical protein